MPRINDPYASSAASRTAGDSTKGDPRSRTSDFRISVALLGVLLLMFGLAPTSASAATEDPDRGPAEHPSIQSTPPATGQQREAARLAVESALAYSESSPTARSRSEYARAGGLGDLAVAVGAARTPYPKNSTRGVGVTLGSAIEPSTPHEVVDLNGQRMTYAAIDGGNAEIVGSTSGDEEQNIIILNGPDAPSSYSFSLTEDELRSGHAFRLSRTVPGGAEIVDASGQVTASIAAPWARTSAGGDVPTYFTVSEGNLIQNVETGDLPPSAYPVVADPSVKRNCGIVTCTWYYSVLTSREMANSALTPLGYFWQGYGASYVCALVVASSSFAPGFNLLLGVVCGGLSAMLMASFSSNLHSARTNNGCFTISTPPRGPFGNVPQSNGNCYYS